LTVMRKYVIPGLLNVGRSSPSGITLPLLANEPWNPCQYDRFTRYRDCYRGG
jgi:hypothetical protein